MSARDRLGGCVYYGTQLLVDLLERTLDRLEEIHARRVHAYHPAPGERHGAAWVARRKDEE